jgi:hypothetical protein
MMFEGLENRIVLSGQWECDVNPRDSNCYIKVEEGSLYYSTTGSATGWNIALDDVDQDTIIKYGVAGALSATGTLYIVSMDRGATIQSENDLVVQGDVATGGQDLTLQADHAITVNGGVTIDTTSASGAGDISIEATHQVKDPGLGIWNFVQTIVDGIADTLAGHSYSRDASVTIESSAVLKGDDIKITATGGDDIKDTALSVPIVGSVLNELLEYFNDFVDFPVSVVVKKSSGTVTVDQGAELAAEGDVELESQSISNAVGAAVYNFLADKFISDKGGFALGISHATADAETMVSGRISAGGDVTIASEANTISEMSAKVAQYGGLHEPLNPTQLQFALGSASADLTSLTTVDTGAEITAAGTVDIKASGEKENSVSVFTSSFGDGKVGATFAVSVATADVETRVDGSVTAGVKPIPDSLVFNPAWTVDFATSSIRFDEAVDFTTGDSVIYDSGLGGPIPGLVSGQQYYAIVHPADPETLQLAASKEDAEADAPLQFLPAYPTLASATIAVPITNVSAPDDTILFDEDPGFGEGDTVTFTAADGNHLGYNDRQGNLVGPLDGTYTVHLVTPASDTDLPAIQLRNSQGETVDLNDSPLLRTADGKWLQVSSFNGTTDQVTLDADVMNALGVTLVNGQALIYTQALNCHVSGLTDGGTYYAIVDPNADDDAGVVIYVASSPTQAQAADPSVQFARPTLAWTTTGDGTTEHSVEINDVDSLDATNVLVFTGNPDIADGTVVTYQAVPGKPIDGLTDGDTYYAYNQANPDFDDVNPLYLISLKTAPTDAEPLQLSAQQLLTRSDDHEYVIAGTDAAHNTLRLVAAEGVPVPQTGDPLTFADAFGAAPIGGLISGRTYYVVVAPLQPYTDSLLVALADSYEDATAASPTFVSLQQVLPLGEVDLSYMSGTEHSLSAAVAASLSITAELESSDDVSTGVMVGSTPTFSAILSAPDLAFDPSVWKRWAKEKLDVGDGVNLKAGGQGVSDWSTATAGAVLTTDNTVLVEIGSHARLETAGEMEISSELTESTQPHLTAQLSKESDAVGQGSPKLAVGVGVLVAVYNNTNQTIVDSGAEIDAGGALTVNATTTYPWAGQIYQPELAKGKFLYDAQIQTLSTLTDGVLGLDTLLCNSWVDVTVPGEKLEGNPNSDIGISAAISLLEFKNKTVASILDGAQINQNVSLQGEEQAVSVTAATEFIQVGFVGQVYLDLSPAHILRAKKRDDPLADLGGGKKKSIGGSLGQVFVDNTTQALIGGPAPDGLTLTYNIATSDPTRVNFGNNRVLEDDSHAPAFEVEAASSITYISLVQGGGRAENVGVTGTVSVPTIHTNSTAQIASGAVVRGNPDTTGDASVTADDTVDVISVAGGVLVSANKEVGVSSSVSAVRRDVFAVVGDLPSVDSTTGAYVYNGSGSSNFDVGGDVTVAATADGTLVAAAMAASIVGSTEPQGQAGQGAAAAELPAGSWGWGFSGDFTLVTLTDNVVAAVNDAGAFVCEGDLSVTSEDLTKIGSGSGAMTIQRNSPTTDKSAGLAGSAAVINVDGTVESVLANASLLRAAGLTVSAERSSNLVSVAAGGSGSFVGNATEVAGSVAVVKRDDTLKALVQNATAVLEKDSSITASDSTDHVSVAGSAALGGKSGFGGSAAVTELNTPITTDVDADSHLAQLQGGLALSASDTSSVVSVAAGLVVSRANQGISADIAAMLTINQLEGDVTATFAGTYDSSESTTSDEGWGLAVSAEDKSETVAVAGEVTWELEGQEAHSSASVGASIVVNTVDGTVGAYLGTKAAGATATVGAGGPVALSATTGRTLEAIAVGVGGAISSGTFGFSLVGSGALNRVTGKTETLIQKCTGGFATGNLGVDAAGAVTLDAKDTSSLTAVAGVASIAYLSSGNASAAVGASVARNEIGSDEHDPYEVTAEIDGSTVQAAGGVSLTARAAPSVSAGSGAGAGSFAGGDGISVGLDGAGAGSTNTIDSDVRALIAGSSVTTTGSGPVSLDAESGFSIRAVAGGVAIAGASASNSAGFAVTVGAAVASNEVRPTTLATLQGSTIESAGAASATATNSATIDATTVGVAASIASGGKLGVAFGGAGSGSGNHVTSDTEACIQEDKGGNPSAISSGQGRDITLTAADNVQIVAGAGSLAFSLGWTSSGSGVSVAPAVGVSVAVNEIARTVQANVSKSSAHAGGGLTLEASAGVPSGAEQSIKAITVAGGIGVGISESGGSVAFPLAGAGSGNTIADTVTASITGCQGEDPAGEPISVTTGTGAVTLSALNRSVILADGGGVTAGGSIGNLALTVAVGMGHAENSITNTTVAVIAASTVTSGGRLSLSADSTATSTAKAFGVAIAIGAANAGLQAGGSSARGYNTIANTIQAYIQNGSTVTAHGTWADAVTVSATDNTTSTCSGGAGSLAVQIGSGAALAVGAVIAENTIANTVAAYIGCDPSAAASNAGYCAPSGTDATLVTSDGGVQVVAKSTAEANALAVAVSVSVAIGAEFTTGAGSGSGASATNTITDTITAAIRNGATVHANGTSTKNLDQTEAGCTVLVQASAAPTITARVGSGAGSVGWFGASVGVALVNNTVNNTVTAYIDAATVTANGRAIDVTATSTNEIEALAVATSLSVSIGAAGAGGSASSTDKTQTSAYVSEATIRTNFDGVQSTNTYGGLNIGASAGGGSISAETDGGTAGIGSVGAFLAKAEVNGGVTAYLSVNGSLQVGDVSVSADGGRAVSTRTIAVIIGGLAGSGCSSTTTVADTVKAYLDDPQAASGAPTSFQPHGAVTIKATSADTGDSQADGGLGGGIGASGNLAYSTVQPAVTAYVDDGVLLDNSGSGGDVTISATAANAATSNAFGVVAAELAVGVSEAKPTASATVSAYVGDAALKVSGDLTISALSTDTARANANASGGAALQGDGAVAAATITPDVRAHAGTTSGAALDVAGDVRLTAAETPYAAAEAYGVTASIALAVGIIRSNATISDTGSVRSYLGAGSSLAADSLTITAQQQQQSGQTQTANALSTAGSGGLLIGADGADSQAQAGGLVQALTGNSVTLPDGDITIQATSRTSQNAWTDGVGVGAVLGVGKMTAEAGSGVSTSATFGALPVMNASRTGALEVQAGGADQNAAWAIAGSGGIVSGNGAAAKTGNTSTVTAQVSGGTIPAGNVAVTASTTSNYAPGVNSINASAAGASGAEAKNDHTTAATVTIGDNTAITAAGTVSIGAQNSFMQTANENASSINQGASAYAGAGGVITGAAAGNHATLNGTARVSLGDSVAIRSGTNPLTNPGGIAIVAAGGIDAQDSVLLSTGGFIEGGGTSSKIDATLANSVTVGAGNSLISWGSIAAGTFNTVNAQTTSQANTGGVAGTADAHASTAVTSTQAVTVGSDSTIQAFGNVNLLAGDDPTGLHSPLFIGTADAQAYAYGGITIPHAESTATLTSHSTLTIDGGVQIGSGRNVTIAARDGSPTGTQAHTQLWNGAGSPSNDPATVNTATSVTQDGEITAGMFHELALTIPDDGSAGDYSNTLEIDSSGPADLDLAAIVRQSSSFTNQFKANDFINHHFNSTDATLLTGSVSSDQTPVGAFTLGPLFAAGGTVTVNGSLQTSSGAITAYGGPTVTVTNRSPDYLVLGPISIPNAASGQVTLNGNASAGDTVSGIAIHLIGAGETPAVTIELNHNGPVGDSTTGPALFVTGTVSNPGGTVSITNDQGSLGQTATIYGQEVSIAAPHGNAAISIPPPGVEYLGTNPYSNWQNFMIWPGGNPFTISTPNANLAVAFVANAVHNANLAHTNAAEFTKALIGQWQSASTDDVPSGGSSTVYLGDSVPYDQPDSGGDDSFTTNANLTFNVTNNAAFGAYQISYNPDDGESRGFFPLIPVETLSRPATAYTSASLPSGSAVPAVQARSVAITAQTIDLNGKIQTTGTPTNWSVVLPGTLTATLLAYRQQYLAGRLRNPQYEIPLADLSTVAHGDSQITATYNAATHQITVAGVSNISTGGMVSLTGAIISTNPQGAIDLQGGIGDVTVDNQTGIPLVVQDIDSGNGSGISQVRIIDKNFPAASNQTLYVYQPGQAIGIWTGPQDATLDQLTQSGTHAGTSIPYQPEAGLRWQWVQTAKLRRDSFGSVNSSNWGLHDWHWENSPGNPWQYVTPGNSAPTSAAVGQLISAPGGSVFQQQITGAVLATTTVHAYYDKNQASHNSFDWYFHFPTEVSLTSTASVKADNPIAVNFGSIAIGNVAIESNAPVRLAGSIHHADGVTLIQALGAITAAAQASIETGDLTLIATGGSIGSDTHPVAATLTNSVLNAQAGHQGVYVHLNSGGTIGSITAGDATQGYGDVVLQATGSLAAGYPAGTATSNVVGKNITLSSRDGAVGTSAQPLVVEAVATALANGGVRHGTVTIQAAGDIGLTHAGGNLLIRSIASRGGDVYLNVPAGGVYDAATVNSPTPTAAEAQRVWQNLSMTDPSFGQAGIVAFEKLAERNYQQYWQLLSNGSVLDNVFTLNAAAIGVYRPQAAAAWETPNPTSGQIQTYAAGLYDQTSSFFDETLAADWRSQADFAAFNPDFRYTATAAQAAGLTLHTQWTTDQLLFFLDRRALQPAGGIPLPDQTPRVTGSSVTIFAAGEVGMVRAPVVVALADIRSGNLTEAEQAALALAHVAGEALLVGTDSQGQTVTFSDGRTPPGVTATGVRMEIHRPLLIALGSSPAAVLNVSAPGGITVSQTAGDLVVGSIDSDGVVDLAATGSIVNAPSVISGFGGNGTGWTANLVGHAATVIADDVLTLTDNNANQARSAWFNTPVSTGSFTASFTYQAGGDKAADGITFAFQNQGLQALGNAGGSLGYAGITGPSAAYQINLYAGHVQGTNFVTNGPGEFGGAGSYFATSPVNVTSGNPIHVALSYDAKAGTLTETLTDQTTTATHTLTYTNRNLAALLGPTAYIGFTGASGGATATQTIREFRFVSSDSQLHAAEVTLQSLSGGIGRSGDPLRMTQGAGQFNASAETGVYVLQTSGNLNVGQVVTDQGDILLDPPEAGQSILLKSTSSVSAPHGHVMFQAHNDVLLPEGSVVEALTVTIQGGFSHSAIAPDARLTLAGLLNAASVLILGGGGSDTVWIGSDGTTPGSLDRILGPIEFRGGGGADALYLDDRAALDAAGQPLRAGYAVTPDQVGNNPGLGFPARAFAGLTYDAGATRLQLLGTAGSAVFHVKPSAGTEFHLDGHSIAGRLAANSIVLDTTGTGGVLREPLLHEGQPVPGAGTWSFSELHRPIHFTGVQNLHSLTLGAVAGTSTVKEATAADATFAVTYQGLTALDLGGLLGKHDAIRVLGPQGYSQLAGFVGVMPSGDGSSQIATYRVPAPGGGWDRTDNGAYTIQVVPGQIRDTLGRVIEAAQIGTLWVNVDALWLTSTLEETGQYRLDVADATPGGVVLLVGGTRAGVYPLSAVGVTLDVADPVYLAEAVADFSGRVQVRVPPALVAGWIGFQALELAPSPQTSRLVYAEPGPRLIAGIESVGTALVGTPTVQFTVTFQQPVIGLSESDFVVAARHVSGARISGLTGRGTTYTITVETGTGDGTLGLNLKDETGIAAATGIASTVTRNGLFAGPVLTIHKTREDVNLDFTVTAQDALILINAINRNRGSFVLAGTALEPAWYDVNSDDWVSALDVLLVVNYVNQLTLPAGEGEVASGLGAERSPHGKPLSAGEGRVRAGTWPAQPTTLERRVPPARPSSIGETCLSALGSDDEATSTELEDVLGDIARQVAWGWQQND